MDEDKSFVLLLVSLAIEATPMPNPEVPELLRRPQVAEEFPLFLGTLSEANRPLFNTVLGERDLGLVIKVFTNGVVVLTQGDPEQARHLVYAWSGGWPQLDSD